MEGGSVPALAGNNVAIEFDGNPVGLGAEMLDERSKSCEFGKVFILTVDVEAHGTTINCGRQQSKGRSPRVLPAAQNKTSADVLSCMRGLDGDAQFIGVLSMFTEAEGDLGLAFVVGDGARIGEGDAAEFHTRNKLGAFIGTGPSARR